MNQILQCSLHETNNYWPWRTCFTYFMIFSPFCFFDPVEYNAGPCCPRKLSHCGCFPPYIESKNHASHYQLLQHELTSNYSYYPQHYHAIGITGEHHCSKDLAKAPPNYMQYRHAKRDEKIGCLQTPVAFGVVNVKITFLEDSRW